MTLVWKPVGRALELVAIWPDAPHVTDSQGEDAAKGPRTDAAVTDNRTTPTEGDAPWRPSAR